MSASERRAFEDGYALAVEIAENCDKGYSHLIMQKEALRRYPDSPAPKNVREMIVRDLKAEGYDGLFWETCSCPIGDLIQCDGRGISSCRPGVLRDGKIVAKDGE